MNKLLVIGNGFDLFLKAKTSYGDYFESDYYKDTRDQVSDWVDKIRLRIVGNRNMLDYDFSCWDLLFYLVSEGNTADSAVINWCDVEKVIHDSFVGTVAESFSWPSVLSSLREHYSRHHISSEQGRDIEHEYALSAMKSYLICKNWKDYCGNESLFYEHLLEELARFEHSFGKYIIQETGNSVYQGKAQVLARRLLKSDKNVLCKIDSFNYSDFSNSFNDIHHVNGDDANPIFGIDLTEVEEIKLPEIRRFTKTFRRIQQDSHNLNRNSERPMARLDSAVIFGHSLNRMDYDYFNYLFTMLRFDSFDLEQMGSIIFVYYIYEDGKSDQIRTGYADSIYALLNYYEGYVGKSKQHILINLLRFSGKLKIVEIKPIQ